MSIFDVAAFVERQNQFIRRTFPLYSDSAIKNHTLSSTRHELGTICEQNQNAI